MHEFSHLMMSHLILKEVSRHSPILLNALPFALGNLRPDVSFKLRKIAHNRQASYEYVVSEIKALAKTPLIGLTGTRYAMRLGVLCHYLCDYCCFVHTQRFNGTLPAHFSYENMLNKHIRRRRKSVLRQGLGREYPRDLSFEGLKEHMDTLIDQYESSPLSWMERDFTSALELCATVVGTVLELSVKEALALYPRAALPIATM